MLLRFIGLMNLMFILACLINTQRKEPNLSDFVRENNIECWFAIGYLLTDFFRTWYDERYHKILRVSDQKGKSVQ